MRVRRLMPVLALAVALVLFGATAPAFAYGDWNTNGVIDLDDYAHFPACLTGPGGGLGTGCGVFDFDSDTDVGLYDFAAFQRVFGTVVIDTVTVGNPGNAGEQSRLSYGDQTYYGSVAYTYNIGKYEVTAGQYTEFLNAVAASDPYGLYSTIMDSDSRGCQITQNGTSGSYTYDFSGRPSGTEADWANRPVNFVSWGDAARFANWLHNGQPTGDQDLTTTEDGSYFLDGAMSNPELMAITTREPDATWVIPSEGEWYKAAYHYNDGVTGNYWGYPTSTNGLPNNGNPEGDTGNSANFEDGDSTIGSPYWRTNVGFFGLSNSPYDTFDQGGNVWEWVEAEIGSYRGLRGGSIIDANDALLASTRGGFVPTYEYRSIGFRVSEVP